MEKHKRIKALPVCSETLKEKCAILQGCNSKECAKKRTCAALELIDHYYDNQKDTILNCLCAQYQYSGRGCPLFRKAGE